MNVVSALVPVATAALGMATQQVAEAVHSSVSFAQLLKEQVTGNESKRGSADAAAAQGGDAALAPDQTPLAGQMQWEALCQRVETLRETVERQLLQRLARQGVDLSEPAVLVADSEGRLLESGGHWDRAKIEQLLADDVELGNSVRQLLQEAAVLRATGRMDAEAGEVRHLRLLASSGGVLLQAI